MRKGTIVRTVAFLGVLLIAALHAAAQDTESRPVTRIAFGSCADQNLPQPIWQAVIAGRPEVFVFLGDNVYGDVTSPEMTELKTAYATFARNESLAALRARARILATWDDHDYGVNDGGADFPWRSQSEALFLDFWRVPADDPRRAREGVYFAEIHGPPGRRVQLVLLDTRSFRSPLRTTGLRRPKYAPDDDPAKTMLGDAQWRWLESELRRPAELRLIVSSIQVIADGHGWERWGNLPRERRRLFDLVAETGAGGVVLLSGDRHLGAVYVRHEGVPYPLHEVTASSFNRPYRNAKEPGPYRLGDVYGDENYGTVEIDWTGRRVELSLRALDGTVVRHQRIALDELAPP